tara:strand:+ start:305 stop:895 length:591 start_codon:yes stop_codon:yes gene_type:complete
MFEFFKKKKAVSHEQTNDSDLEITAHDLLKELEELSQRWTEGRMILCGDLDLPEGFDDINQIKEVFNDDLSQLANLGEMFYECSSLATPHEHLLWAGSAFDKAGHGYHLLEQDEDAEHNYRIALGCLIEFENHVPYDNETVAEWAYSITGNYVSVLDVLTRLEDLISTMPSREDSLKSLRVDIMACKVAYEKTTYN